MNGPAIAFTTAIHPLRHSSFLQNQHPHEPLASRKKRSSTTRHHTRRPRHNPLLPKPIDYSPNKLNATIASKTADQSVENVVIIGSGPAGYTAALYAGRANLRPLVLEGAMKGIPGGQLMTTDEVENYPGFPSGITGPQLMESMKLQALRYDSRIISDDCISIDLDTHPYIIKSGMNGEFRANSVIIATGATAKRLNIQGEIKFWGKGISACAVCDGAAPIFNAVHVAVVGGGDSACEEAVYLCKYAHTVHLLVRSNRLKASSVLIDRVLRHPRVIVHFNTNVIAAVGQDAFVSSSSGLDEFEDESRSANVGNDDNGGSPLKGLRIRNNESGTESNLQVRGLFYAIGHSPNTEFLKSSSRLRFDPAGYLKTGNDSNLSSSNSHTHHQYGGTSPYTGQDGVFAAGDVADPVWRQAVTAAASGCMSALAAEKYLTDNNLIIEYHQAPTEEKDNVKPVNEESEEEKAVLERGTDDDEKNYNIENTWHVGQFALRKLYHESTRPIIVKYVSPTCGPCKQLKPLLHSVIRNYEGHVHYVEIDMSRDMEIAEAAGVTGSPTVQIFHEKSLVKELRGVKMKSDYRQVVESILGQPSTSSST